MHVIYTYTCMCLYNPVQYDIYVCICLYKRSQYMYKVYLFEGPVGVVRNISN